MVHEPLVREAALGRRQGWGSERMGTQQLSRGKMDEEIASTCETTEDGGRERGGERRGRGEIGGGVMARRDGVRDQWPYLQGDSCHGD